MKSDLLLRKLAGIAIIILIIFPSTFYLSKALEQPPEERLRRWLQENLVIYAFSPYRGPLYPVVGDYEEPKVTVASAERAGRVTRITEKEMTYGDFVRSYVAKDGQPIGGMNITIIGFVKEGPIRIRYEGYSFIFNTTVRDPMLFAGGAYLASEYPTVSEMINEGDVTIFTFRFPIAEPIFYSRPEYLYSYSSLANKSKLSLPLGEGLFLALGIKGVPPRDALAGALRDAGVPFPQSLTRLIRSLPADDPMASVIAVEWSAEGHLGAMARVALTKHPLITACGEYVISSSAMPVAADKVEEERRRIAARLSGESPGSFKLCRRELYILAPVGSVGDKVEALADLSEGPAALLFSTAAYYSLRPDVKAGEDKIRAKIIAYRGAVELTLSIAVSPGGERFSIEESNVRFRHQEISSVGEWGAYASVEAGALTLRREERDELGVLRLVMEATTRSSEHELTRGAFFEVRNANYEEVRTAGIALIGGWRPNPLPPGNAIIVEGLEHSFHGVRRSETIEEFKIGRVASGGLLIDTNCTSPSTLVEIRGRVNTEFGDKYRSYLLSDVSPLNASSLYDFAYRGGGSEGIGLLSLGETFGVFLSVEVSQENRATSLRVTQRESVSSNYVPLLDTIWWGCYVTVGYLTRVELYELATSFETEGGSRSHALERRISYGHKETADVGAAEVPETLYLMTSRREIFAGENLSVSVMGEGKRVEDVRVRLEAELIVGKKKIPVPVSPSELSLSRGASATALLRLPSTNDLINATREELTDTALVVVRAFDSRGLSAAATALVRVSGLYLVLNVTDVMLAIPPDPWNAPVLSSVAGGWRTGPREGPADGAVRAFLSVRVVDAETGRPVKYEFVYDIRSLKDGRMVIQLDLREVKPRRKLYVAYDFEIEYLKVKVEHAGITFEVPERIEGLVRIERKLYVPYSILAKHNELSKHLAGHSGKYQRSMPDHQLFINLPARALALIEGAISSLSGPEGKIARDLIGYMRNYLWESTKMRPRIWLPHYDGSVGYRSELSVLSEGIDMKSVRFRLTPEDLADNPSNYWSQLAKFVMYEAEVLRTYKYVTSSTMLLAKILALAMTLEIFKGYFSYTKFWNKENLFAKMSKKVNLPPELVKRLKVSKVSVLFLSGEALGVFGIAAIFTNYNVAIQLLNEITGSSEASAILISLIFKIVRFVFSYIVGEFRAEFRFEIIFLALQALIAHLLVMVYNAWTQYLLLREIMIEPYPTSFDFPFILSVLSNYVRYSLDVPVMSGGVKPQKDRWENRQEMKGAIMAAISWEPSERLYYSAADFYQLLEMFSALTLSVARGMDGAYEIERRRANVPDHEAFRTVLRFMNMPIEYKDARGQTVKVGIKDVIAKLYLALAAALAADAAMKTVWLPAFMNALVEEDPLRSNAAIMVVSTLQTVGPALAGMLMARARLEGSRPSSQGALELSPATGIERELEALSASIAEGGESLAKMMAVNSYDLLRISEFVTAADRAEMIVRRAALASSDVALRENLSLIVHELVAARGILTEILAYHLSYPAAEASKDALEVVRSLAASMASAVMAASVALRNSGAQQAPVPPTIVIREWDISWEDRGSELEISVALHNVGDAPAEVEVNISSPSSASAEARIEARASGEVSLRLPSRAREGLEILSLQLSVDGRPSHQMEIALPRGSVSREASSQDLAIISRGSVNAGRGELVAENAEAFLVRLPAPVEGQSYVMMVGDRILKMGEMRAGNDIILGAHFARPFSGKIELKRVVVESRVRLEGSGTLSAGNVTVSSPAGFSVKVSMLRETEELRSALGRREEGVRFVAVDILWASAGSVTIEIDVGPGVSRAKVYKFAPEKESFVELSAHEVINGKIRLTLRPGDPIFAIVPEGRAEGIGPLLPVLPPALAESSMRALLLSLLALVAAIALLAVLYKRRRG